MDCQVRKPIACRRMSWGPIRLRLKHTMMHMFETHVAYNVTKIHTCIATVFSGSPMHVGGKAFGPPVYQTGGKALTYVCIRIGDKALETVCAQIGGQALTTMCAPILAVRP